MASRMTLSTQILGQLSMKKTQYTNMYSIIFLCITVLHEYFSTEK